MASPALGVNPYRKISAGSQDAAVVKAARGKITGIYATNENTTTWAYLKLYNKATSPSGSDTPVLSLGLPPGGGGNSQFPAMDFSAGIGVRIVADAEDAGTTAVTAGDVVVNIWYE